MLKEIELRNFQRHKKLKISFGRVTTIVGPSDAGKSAVIRALRWSLLNKPTGATYSRRGTEACSVAVRVDEHSIVRGRRKSTNTYKLDEHEFKAFGSSIPEPIEEVVNLCDDNFQNQHDSPYWLGLSSGELSRALNQVVDLSIIDKSISSLNKEIRKAKATVEVVEDRLASSRKECKENKHFLDMDKDLKTLEKLESKMAKAKKEYIEFGDTLNQYMKNVDRVCELDFIVNGMSNDLSKIDEIHDEMHKVQEKHDILEEAVNDYKDKVLEIQRHETELGRVETKLNKYKTCPVCGKKL